MKSFVQLSWDDGMHNKRLFIICKHRGINPGYDFDDSLLAAVVSDSSSSVSIPIVDFELHSFCR